MRCCCHYLLDCCRVNSSLQHPIVWHTGSKDGCVSGLTSRAQSPNATAHEDVVTLACYFSSYDSFDLFSDAVSVRVGGCFERREHAVWEQT